MSRKIGSNFELVAQEYLKKRGYKIVAANVTYGFGELDIIAKDKETLVFIEVKYRSRTEMCSPFEAVTKAKQKKIIKAAEAYLQKITPIPFCRFDVISVAGNPEHPEIEHLIDAFWTE